MKFEKFVKRLASTGVIYQRDYKERWLASPTVVMLIPELTRSITGVGIEEMPAKMNQQINAISQAEEARLTKAIMPYPDGKISDCLRIYSTKSGEMNVAISNDDYNLIEKSDLVEILYRYDFDENKTEPVALRVTQYAKLPTDPELSVVGLIFPAEIPQNANF